MVKVSGTMYLTVCFIFKIKFIMNVLSNEDDLYWEVFDYKSYELYYDKVQELMNDEMFNQITREV